MPESSPPTDAMFPLLTEKQISQLEPFGERREALAGDIVFEQGDSSHGIFLVMDGSIELVAVATRSEASARRAQANFKDWTGQGNSASAFRRAEKHKAVAANSHGEPPATEKGG